MPPPVYHTPTPSTSMPSPSCPDPGSGQASSQGRLPQAVPRGAGPKGFARVLTVL
jgi:hypothetical protein